MKIPKAHLVTILAVVFAIVVLPSDKAVASSKNKNHCFTCHTSARKLIQITREISKLNKEKPGASPETKGEG